MIQRFIESAACAFAAAAALAAGAQAQLAGAGTERNNTMQVVIREPGDGPVSETLDLPFGQAAVVHLPVDAAEVIVASEAVADAVVRTPRRALLMGQAVGRTNIFFFNADGELILDLDVRVERDMAALQDALNRFVPDSRVQAESMNSNIVLSGTVPSASAADAALQIARRWTDEDDQVISFLTVEGRDQVMLRVRIVEMERNIVRQLGVNLSARIISAISMGRHGCPRRTTWVSPCSTNSITRSSTSIARDVTRAAPASARRTASALQARRWAD